MSSVSEAVDTYVMIDLFTVGALGPSALRCENEWQELSLQWIADWWHLIKEEIREYTELCVKDICRHPFSGIGEVILELRRRRDFHTLAAYVTGVQEATKSIQKDHALNAEPAMRLLPLSQCENHRDSHGQNEGSIPWLRATQCSGMFDEFWAELNAYIEQLEPCEDEGQRGETPRPSATEKGSVNEETATPSAEFTKGNECRVSEAFAGLRVAGSPGFPPEGAPAVDKDEREEAVKVLG